MTKISLIIFIFLISISGVFATPYKTLVAADNQYTSLAPIPGITDGNCDTSKSIAEQSVDPQCNVSAGKYIPRLVILAIQVAGALAVLMIVIGGIQYATADAISGKSAGKEKVEDAIKGLLLAIGAYVIMYTINPSTLSLTLTIPNYYGSSIKSPNASSTPVTPTPSGDLKGLPWPSSWPGGAPSPTDASVRAQLSNLPVPITVNKSNCVTVGDTSCTSLDGLGQRAIAGLLSLSQKCQFDFACSKSTNPITVTGGTEFWFHGNKKTDPSLNTDQHRPGGNWVDISKGNPDLNKLIMTGTPMSTSGGCPAPGPRYNFNGVVYVDETGGVPHWHVCY